MVMERKLHHLRPQAQANAGSVCLAVVCEAHSGQATFVGELTDGDDVMKVTGHASEVPPLEVGDRVAILVLDEGAVVTHRLRGNGERPRLGLAANADGSVMLEAARGITIRTTRAQIELRGDGRIVVNGREIYALADGLHRLQGATIELN